MSKHVIKHPGGAILHMKDGAAEYFAYGQEVDPDKLADYQVERLGDLTDGKDRSAYAREAPRVEQDAHRNAAFADGGQVNSTSDPIPGNYGELSEEDAAQLVMSIPDPQIQARFLLHERLHHGSRQMVIDAGQPLAQALAEVEFKNASEGLTHYDQSPVIDRERQIERDARAQERRQGDKLTGEALKERAAELDIEGRSDMTAGELRAAVAEAESSGGRTPPPQS